MGGGGNGACSWVHSGRGNSVCPGSTVWEGEGMAHVPGSTVGGGIAYVQGPQYGRGREWRMFLGPRGGKGSGICPGSTVGEGGNGICPGPTVWEWRMFLGPWVHRGGGGENGICPGFTGRWRTCTSPSEVCADGMIQVFICSYLRCFYIGLLLVSNIHEQEERNATNTVEFVAEIVGYMLGVFTLAVIIGEVLE